MEAGGQPHGRVPGQDRDDVLVIPRLHLEHEQAQRHGEDDAAADQPSDRLAAMAPQVPGGGPHQHGDPPQLAREARGTLHGA